MGFISSFLKGEIPHRTFGLMAKDSCTGHLVSEKEVYILNKLSLDIGSFIPERNALLIKIFNLYFLTLDNKQTVSNPETIKAAHGFFTARIANYYDSLPEAEKLKMEVVNTALDYYEDIESAAERFYRKISGESFDSLFPDLQAEFKEFVNSYFNEVDSFFKKNSPKYLW